VFGSHEATPWKGVSHIFVLLIESISRAVFLLVLFLFVCLFLIGGGGIYSLTQSINIFTMITYFLNGFIFIDNMIHMPNSAPT
jgi:hypothetical protein